MQAPLLSFGCKFFYYEQTSPFVSRYYLSLSDNFVIAFFIVFYSWVLVSLSVFFSKTWVGMNGTPYCWKLRGGMKGAAAQTWRWVDDLGMYAPVHMLTRGIHDYTQACSRTHAYVTADKHIYACAHLLSQALCFNNECL